VNNINNEKSLNTINVNKNISGSNNKMNNINESTAINTINTNNNNNLHKRHKSVMINQIIDLNY
jgi:hypothetical protein